MLICSVSLRPSGRAITSSLVEAAAAVDAATTGFVVFATLVDDPASVGDVVDAYLGEIMLESASASDTISVGLAYDVAVDESLSADDAVLSVGGGTLVPRQAMVAGRLTVFINSSGIARSAYVDGVMVNL